MKKALALFAVAGFVTFHAAGQSSETTKPSTPNPPDPASQADLLKMGPSLSPQMLDAMVRFQTATLTRLLGINLTIDGVLPRVYRVDYPLHLINPFAPAKYGSGLDNVSINPRTGQAEGIVLLGIKF